jgi:VCBS repeat-containing protein
LLSSANAVTYKPSANFNGSDTLTMISSDGTASDTDTVAITVTPVNDAPVNAVPAGTQSTSEDTAKVITGLSIADVDAGTSPVTVTLAVTNGTITAATSTGVTITTNGTASVTLSGTVSAINTLLALANGVTYTPTANFNGSATLTLTTNDNGNTGSGGAKSDVDTVTINVSGVNDVPVNTVPGAQTTAEDTDKVITGLQVADADAGSSTMTVTLSVTNGTLAVGAGTGVSIATNNSASVVLTGTLADINALLSSANAVTYKPSANFNGSDTLTMISSDGTASDTDTVAITVTPVNDAPVIVTPANALTTLEDTATTFVISTQLAGKVTDVDGTALKGIVIVVQKPFPTAVPTGTWAYSTDGTTWVDFPTTYLNTVDWTQVMYLNASDSLRFTPFANNNGANLADLNFRAVDATFPNTASGTKVNVVGNIGGTGAVSNQPGHFTVSVTPVNDAPVAVADTASIQEAGGRDNNITGTALASTTIGFSALNVLANDTDLDSGDTKSVSAILKGTTGTASVVGTGTNSITGQSIVGDYGTLVIGADGSYTYAVNQDNTSVQALNVGSTALNDVFTYTVKDTAGLTSTATLTVAVSGANDAPVWSGVTRSTNEDVTFEQQVSSILAGRFTDVDSSGVAGIAIIWDFGAGQGTTGIWYWADSTQATWTAINKPGYGPSTSIFLKTTDYLRFVPAPNEDDSTQQGNLLVRVADDSMPITASGTVLDLSNLNNFNYWSAAELSIIVNLNPVNDAPVINTTPALSLPTISEDTLAPIGLSPTAGMGVRNDITVISDADTLPQKGIAITSVNSNGTLYYSLNNGATWQAAGALTTNALLLDNNSRVFFQPNANWNGTIDNAFQYRAWDQTNATAVIKAGAFVSIGATGGSTAYSQEVGKVGITVTPDLNLNAKIDITAITTDSGISATDYITNDNTLVYSGTVSDFITNGARVKLELIKTNNADGSPLTTPLVVDTTTVDPTMTGTSGTWTWNRTTTAQADATYQLRATIVDALGSRVNPTSTVGSNTGTQDVQAIVIDTNSPNVDPNRNATIDIVSIVDTASSSQDTGTSSTDFITSDRTLTYKGTITAASTAPAGWDDTKGDLVKLVLRDSSNAIVATQYVVPTKTSTGANWIWNDTGVTREANTTYTLEATIIDAAGNPVNHVSISTSTPTPAVLGTNGGIDTQLITIDTAAPTQIVSFSSMTKDSGVTNTPNINSNWLTNDTSAGRLVSGFLSAPLAAGEVLNVYSNNVLIGTATVATGGTTWEITDLNGYATNASWTYTAKVVDAAANTGPEAERIVNTDLTEGAPVITGVFDTVNSTTSIVNNGSTTNALSSVKGTAGVASAGNTIYLYDNNYTTLVGTAVVDGTGNWSVTSLTGTFGGSNTFAAKQVDAQGNHSVLSNLWKVSSSVNLIVNGMFDTNANGWTVGAPSGVALPKAIDGTGSLGRLTYNSGDTGAGGWAFQNMTTTSGTNYSVSMLAGGNTFTSPTLSHTLLIEVLDGTTVLSSATRVITASAGVNINFNFTAASSTTTLRITNTAVVNSATNDVWIDNVSVIRAAYAGAVDLVAGSSLQGTSGVNSLTYTAGAIDALGSNDTITVTGTDLQAKLQAGGNINGGAGVDNLKLAAGSTLNLSAVSGNQTVKPIEQVEMFTMQGGNSVLTLSANSVLSLGGSNATTMSPYTFSSTTQSATGNSGSATGSTTSTGKVQFVVNGLTGDTLNLEVLANDGVPSTNGASTGQLGNTGLAGTWAYKGTITIAASVAVDGIANTYKVYDHSTTGAQVLVDVDVAVNTITPITVTAISEDRGTSATDFITSDQTLSYSGVLPAAFDPASQRVRVQLFDATNQEVTTPTNTTSQYAAVSGTTWSWDNTSATRPAGNYTIKATIVGLTNDTPVASYGTGGTTTQPITIELTPPTVAITRTDGLTTTVGDTGTQVTFTLSEASSDFTWNGTSGDITVTGGTLSALVQSNADPKVYTATFTPAAGSSGNATIGVLNGKFSDVAGNFNLDTYTSPATAPAVFEANNLLTVAYDTAAPTQIVSFSSMTKDSGVTTTANNSNWLTNDTSAGRLVSGFLSAPLAAGEVVNVYSNNILIGTATVAAGGTTWAITDLNGYATNASWTYTAKVVDAAANAGSEAERIVNTDLTEAAPVITGVFDTVNSTTTVSNNGTTTNALSRIDGTGGVGDTIYLYDNTGANLVGSTTVGANGFWSITGLASNAALGAGSNTFAAIQMDANGNTSALSNLWTVSAPATNTFTNGGFETGNLSGFSTTMGSASFVWDTDGGGVASVGKYNIVPFLGTVQPAIALSQLNNGTWAQGTWSEKNNNIANGVTGYDTRNKWGAMSNGGKFLFASLDYWGLNQGYSETSKKPFLQTDLNVVAGKTYTVSFDYYNTVFNNLGTSTPAQRTGVDVLIDGQKVMTTIARSVGTVTIEYTATTTGTVPLQLAAFTSYANADIALDNFSFSPAATSPDGSLVAGQFLFATPNPDSLNYTVGALDAMGSNDTITVTGTDLQAKLQAGGNINGGAGIDNLKLIAGTKLNLTAVTGNQTVKPIEQVEMFTMQGGNSVLTLSANSVLSLGGSNATTMSPYTFSSTTQSATGNSGSATGSTTSTGKVQFVVNGLTGDTLNLDVLANDGVPSTNGASTGQLGNTGLAGTWAYKGTISIAASVAVDGIAHTYKVYDHSTTGAQVLVDANVAVNTITPITITAISEDRGISASDFITNDQTLSYGGGLPAAFNPATERVLVEIVNSSNVVVSSGFATSSVTTWSWNNQADTELAGNYTIRATIVGLTNTTPVASYGASATSTQALTIDLTTPTVAISRTDGLSTSVGAAGTQVSFTLSEASNDFTNVDIEVSGGTLSPLFQSSTMVYTATFMPDANATGTGYVRIASTKFSDAAGNQNLDTYAAGANFQANNLLNISYDSRNIATITGNSTGAVTEDATINTASGTVTVNDPDAGENVLQTPTNLAGTYGNFTVTAAGAWAYTLDNTKAATQALAAGTNVTDKLNVKSLDGSANQDITVTITGVNDAPFLETNNGATYILPSTTTAPGEPAPGTQVGSLVSNLLASWVTDAEGPSVPKGIAVTEVDTSRGVFWYSTNNGAIWIKLIGGTSNTQALLLASDANHRVYFQNTSGTTNLTSAFKFRAWDQTSPETSGFANTTVNGGTTAFSTDTAWVSLSFSNGPAPVNSVPTTAQTVNEDVQQAITGISVNDADNNLATTQLSVAHGTLNVTLASGATISAGANDSGTLTLSGNQTAINNTLATLKYRSNVNYNGADTLTVLSTDANGGKDSDNVAITVTPVNDAPFNTVPGIQTTAEDTAKVITGLSIADVEAGQNAMTVTVTLAVTNGTITAATSANVTITNNGNASVTLSGNVSAINTLLGLANGVTYTPTANFSGSATLTMTTNDNGNSGSGGAKSDTDTVTINVTATSINQAPVMTDADGNLPNSLGVVTAPADTAYAPNFADTTSVDITRTATSGTLSNGGVVTLNGDGSTNIVLAAQASGFEERVKYDFAQSASSINVRLEGFTPGDTLQVMVNGQALVVTPDMVGGTNSVAVPNTAGTTLVGTARTQGGTAVDAFELTIDATKAPGGIRSLEFIGKSDLSGGGFKIFAPTNLTPEYNSRTVQQLFGGTYTDADNDAMKGVAVTFAGTTQDISNFGTYSFSSDGGKNWNFLLTGLNDANAVFLRPSDLVRFVPSALNTSTFKQDLTVRLVDTSGATNSGSLVSGSPVDVSVNGGAEAYSLRAATLKTLTTLTINTVTPDNILSVTESTVNTNVVSGSVTGQFAANDKVTVTINGTQYTTAVSSTGTWSITNASGNDLKLDADSKVEASIMATTEAGQVNAVANQKAYTLDFAKITTTGGFATSYTNTTVDVNSPSGAVDLRPVAGTSPAGPQAFTTSVRNGNNASGVWSDGGLVLNPQNIKDPEGNGAGGEYQSGEIMVTARGSMTFTRMQFTIYDLQNGLVAGGAKTATFYDANGQAISSVGIPVTGHMSTALVDSGVLSRPAVSMGISGGNRDWALIYGMKVTATQFPVPFEIPIESNDAIVDQVPEIHGTLSQALTTGQVVKIYNNGTLMGNATVNGLTWSYLPSIAALSTNSLVAKVVVNATNAVITEAAPFVITQSPSGITPLMLDLNGDGVQTTTLQNGTAFDLDADGDLDKTAWADKRDGLLVMDLNGDGKIGNGRELFGSATVLKNGETATDGFKALRDLDDNQDGVIDANDAAFAKLKVWLDANGNGVTDEGELKSLQEMGIVSMKLNAQASDLQQNGNTLGLISEYTTADGKTHQLVDVWLDVAEQSFALENKPYELSDKELALINATPLIDVQTVAKSEVTAEEVAPAISVCTGAAESSTYSLSNGQSLDLTTVLKDMSVNGIVKGLEQVDMVTDTSANMVSLSLADVLSLPSTGGVYKLMLSGAANDKVMLAEGEWTDTGAVVDQGGQSYAVYTGTNDSSAQLLIDQQMLQSQHNG